MPLSNPLTPTPSRLAWFGWGLLLLAILGFSDATFLTIKHYTGGVIPCAITTGCEVVTTSKYATVAGIPVALAGAAFYFVMAVVSILVLDTKAGRWLRLAAWLSIAGLGASLYLVMIQVAVLHSYCLYCLLSAGTSTMLWVVSWWGWRWQVGHLSSTPL